MAEQTREKFIRATSQLNAGTNFGSGFFMLRRGDLNPR
jgi:hypothetical protein